MANKTLVLFFLFTSILFSCGRPKDFKEQAILSFKGAHSAFAYNNYEKGVLIYGKWDKHPKHIWRFWIRPGVDKVETVNIFVPTGKVTFYGVGADSNWNFNCDITKKKKLKPAQRQGFTLKLSSVACTSSNDLLYNRNSMKKAQFNECIRKGKLNCGKYDL